MKILITILAYYLPKECKSNTRSKFVEGLLEIWWYQLRDMQIMTLMIVFVHLQNAC